MQARRKFVRGFSLDGWPLRGEYGWYLLKKAACLVSVLGVVLLVYARLPVASPWLSIALLGAIAAAGFWLSGRIRMSQAADDPGGPFRGPTEG